MRGSDLYFFKLGTYFFVRVPQSGIRPSEDLDGFSDPEIFDECTDFEKKLFTPIYSMPLKEVLELYEIFA